MNDSSPESRPYVRDETAAQRFDRNYAELLQELRVAQTGVQILFAFLLGIAFQQRFTELSHAERVLYVITLVSSALAAVVLIGPVAGHRILFGRNRKHEVVILTARLASAGLVVLAVAILSSVLLVGEVVAGLTTAIVITALLGAVVLGLWIAVPVTLRRRPDPPVGADT